MIIGPNVVISSENGSCANLNTIVIRFISCSTLFNNISAPPYLLAYVLREAKTESRDLP